MPQNQPNPAMTDQQIENVIGVLLRAGVILSALVVLFGGVVYLSHHRGAHTDYRIFHSEPAGLRNISSIAALVFHWRGQAIIQLGLLLLIATPVARVAFSVWGFAREHDRLFVIFTLIVLAILLYSMFGPTPG